MNILYVVHDNKKGGAAISFLELISIINGRHNVFVLIPHKTGYIPEQLEKMGIPYMNAHYFWWEIETPKNKFMAKIKISLYKLLNCWNYIEAKRIKRELAKWNIDIIHSNSSVINFGGLIAALMDIPHVWHLREVGVKLGMKIVPSYDKYYKEMSSLGDAYIAISDSVKEDFTKIINSKKIFRIYNGVSEKFVLKKYPLTEVNDKIRFLIAGNYCREKGQIDVAMAALELLKRGITQFSIYMAGSGDFVEPKKIVEENHLEKYIQFLGNVDNMVDLRKDTDVEIVATKYEAFGRVTIEAMRMSNPVIATNSGGSKELIIQGENGFLFPYANNIELANIMEHFIQNKQLVCYMGNQAYLTVYKKFLPIENANKIEDIYTSLKKKIKD